MHFTLQITEKSRKKGKQACFPVIVAIFQESTRIKGLTGRTLWTDVLRTFLQIRRIESVNFESLKPAL